MVLVEMEKRDGLGCISKTEKTKCVSFLSRVVKERIRDEYEAPHLGSLETGSVTHKVKWEGEYLWEIIHCILDLITGYPNINIS